MNIAQLQNCLYEKHTDLWEIWLPKIKIVWILKFFWCILKEAKAKWYFTIKYTKIMQNISYKKDMKGYFLIISNALLLSKLWWCSMQLIVEFILETRKTSKNISTNWVIYISWVLYVKSAWSCRPPSQNFPIFCTNKHFYKVRKSLNFSSVSYLVPELLHLHHMIKVVGVWKEGHWLIKYNSSQITSTDQTKLCMKNDWFEEIKLKS